jgi:hypothetical protein
MFHALQKLWRLFNFGLFIFALIGPWGRLMGDLAIGGGLVLFYIFLACYYLLFLFTNLAMIWGLILALLHSSFVALSAYYWFINLKRILNTDNAWWHFKFDIPLVLCAIALALDAIFRIYYDPYRNDFWVLRYYWGYWLMLLCIGSCIVLEVIGHLTEHIYGESQDAKKPYNG